MSKSRSVIITWCGVVLISALTGLAADRPTAIPLQRRVEELAQSLERIARMPEIGQPDSAESRAASRLLYRLNGLPAIDRYALLKKWTLSAADRNSVRHLMVLLHDPPPPNVFLPEPLPPVEDPLVSSLTMLVDAARELGKLDELANAVQPLVADTNDGAARLHQLIQRAVHDKRPASLGALLDEALIEQMLTQAKQRADFRMILWLYRTRAIATIANSDGATLKPSADPGLKHWIPVDLASGANYNTFGSSSWWLAGEDRIGHICSPWVDHLAFAYPLTGTFEISCEAFNDFWSEGNIGFGGLIFEPWNQGSRNRATYPANAHEVIGGPNPVEKLAQFNPLTIHREPKRLRVTGIGEQLFEDTDPSTTSPFFFLRTTWLCAFRKIRITGQPVIPREVSLVAGQRMDGWMTSFYSESQPPELSIRQDPQGPPRNKDPQAYDWAAVDGVLHARRVPEPNPRPKDFPQQESWAYYHRPLRNRERISYEFFYQPAKPAIEVHPTLDRLAFLFDPQGVKLHWLTADRTANALAPWLPIDNVAEEPLCRRGPSPLPLKLNDWNAVTIELHEGLVRILLNGQLIYERPQEAAWGTRFGFYHDRGKSSAQIRNVVLTGDWPEWSPQLAKNLLERTQPLAPGNQAAIQAILTPRLMAD